MSIEKFNIGQNLDGEKVQLTKQGEEELKVKLNHLVNDVRPIVLAELAEARAQGDLSENADYDAAKNKQAEVEAEIANLQNILSRVEIVQETASSVVKVGSFVTYEKEGSGESRTIQVVGSVQANPMAEIPLIGVDAPLAKAVIGSKVGDTIRVDLQKKSYKVTIKKIK